MTEIIQKIDEWTAQQFAAYSLLLYGFCELGKRTNNTSTQPLPMTITGTHKRQQVALDDRKQFITWIRIPGVTSFGQDVEDQDWGFGLDAGNVSTTGLRMIVAHKVELGENVIFDLAINIPDLFQHPSFKVISVDKSGISIDMDHEEIYNTELGSGQYEKHRTAWNIYAVNIPVQYISC